MSPIGPGALSWRGLSVIGSEIVLLWLPALTIRAMVRWLKRRERVE